MQQGRCLQRHLCLGKSTPCFNFALNPCSAATAESAINSSTVRDLKSCKHSLLWEEIPQHALNDLQSVALQHSASAQISEVGLGATAGGVRVVTVLQVNLITLQ